MADPLFDKVLNEIKDPRIRQALSSDLGERAVFGSGGVSGFLGTTELPPEAYGTDFTQLPKEYQGAMKELKDIPLKSLRTQAGIDKATSALSKQGVKGPALEKFVTQLREAAELWLNKDSRVFMKEVGQLKSVSQAPSKIGHIADLLKVNKAGTPMAQTLWKMFKGGAKLGGKSAMFGLKAPGYAGLGILGAGALVGGYKYLTKGTKEERPDKVEAKAEELVVKEPETTEEKIKNIDWGEGSKPVESMEDLEAMRRKILEGVL